MSIFERARQNFGRHLRRIAVHWIMAGGVFGSGWLPWKVAILFAATLVMILADHAATEEAFDEADGEFWRRLKGQGSEESSPGEAKQ